MKISCFHEMVLIAILFMSSPSFGQNKDKYSYPMYPGDAVWNSYKTTQDRAHEGADPSCAQYILNSLTKKAELLISISMTSNYGEVKPL